MMLSQMKTNMTNLGWTEVDDAESADLVLLPEEPDVVGCLPDHVPDLPEPIPGGATFARFADAITPPTLDHPFVTFKTYNGS